MIYLIFFYNIHIILMGEIMNYLKYLKFVGVFIIIELMITFIISLLNLVGVNSGITSIILLILNISIFFSLSFINGKTSKQKGFLSGFIISILFISIMYLINGLLFSFTLKISTIIYYIILIIISILGGSIGINKKKEDN